MKKVKNLVAFVFVLVLCLGVCSAASYGPLTLDYGEDYGDYGFYFPDCLYFDAAMEKDVEGAKLITMKPGSSLHFYNGDLFDNEFFEDMELEGCGSIYYARYAKAEPASSDSDYWQLEVNGETYVPASEEGYGETVDKKKSMTTDELFADGVCLLVFYSSQMQYYVVPEASAPAPTTPATPAAPVSPAVPTVANPTSSPVLVNGKNVSFDAYNISDNNYFKLRDLAYILSGSEKQFEVTWDATANAINLISGQPYTAVGNEMASKGSAQKKPLPTTSVIYLDGVEIALTAYNIDGNNYFKLRDLGEALNFEVDWDSVNKTIVIDAAKGYTPD